MLAGKSTLLPQHFTFSVHLFARVQRTSYAYQKFFNNFQCFLRFIYEIFSVKKIANKFVKCKLAVNFKCAQVYISYILLWKCVEWVHPCVYVTSCIRWLQWWTAWLLIRSVQRVFSLVYWNISFWWIVASQNNKIKNLSELHAYIYIPAYIYNMHKSICVSINQCVWVCVCFCGDRCSGLRGHVSQLASVYCAPYARLIATFQQNHHYRCVYNSNGGSPPKTKEIAAYKTKPKHIKFKRC